LLSEDIIDKEINPTLEQVYKNYVYNIEVENFHTYYVSKAGILTLTHTSANIAP